MKLKFSHHDVLQNWKDAASDVLIDRQEFSGFCFADVESENCIEVFSASTDGFPNLLSFWICAIKPSLLEGGDPRWESEYLAGGTVRSITANEFDQWLRWHLSTLLPDYKLDVPSDRDQFAHVWINHMDEALVGIAARGYWALRWFSTA